jgi:alcohol dehydrogenase
MTAEMNLNLLYQQQLKIFGSFGCTRRNMADAMVKLASGIVRPVIDTKITLEELDVGLKRLESRQVFGKIVITL